MGQGDWRTAPSWRETPQGTGEQPQAKKDGPMRRTETIPDNITQPAPRVFEPGFALTLSLLHPGLPTQEKSHSTRSVTIPTPPLP